MRWTIVALSLLAAACGGQDLTSPTARSAMTGAGLGATQARAGTDLPFHGSFTRESHSAFEPPITLVISGTQTGTATHLGQFVAVFVERVNTTNNTATGSLNFTAANGDQLFTETAGAETEFVPPNTSVVTMNARIVGGTGRFEGATGTLTIHVTETIDFASNSATGSGSFEGRVNLNE
jgi:hypothetical protein